MLFQSASIIVLFAAVSANAAALQVRQASCTPPVVTGAGTVWSGCAVANTPEDAKNAAAIQTIADYFNKQMGCKHVVNAVAPLVGHISASSCTNMPNIETQSGVAPGFMVNTEIFEAVCGPGDKC